MLAWPHLARCIAGWEPSRLGVGNRWGRGCPRQAPNDGEAPPRRHGIEWERRDEERSVRRGGGKSDAAK